MAEISGHRDFSKSFRSGWLSTSVPEFMVSVLDLPNVVGIIRGHLQVCVCSRSKHRVIRFNILDFLNSLHYWYQL